jgi:hypothetical protein
MSLNTRAEELVEMARAEETLAGADVEIVQGASPFSEQRELAGWPEFANYHDFETFSDGAGI